MAKVCNIVQSLELEIIFLNLSGIGKVIILNAKGLTPSLDVQLALCGFLDNDNNINDILILTCCYYQLF